MDPTLFNILEGSFWLLIGVLLLIFKGGFKKDFRIIALIAGIVFIFFGATDFFEIYAVERYFPWWLLIMKVIAIAGFVIVWAWYAKVKIQKDLGDRVLGNRIIKADEDGYYPCPECKMRYVEYEIAEKCFNWCREHKSCNLEIVDYSIGLSPEENENSNYQ